MKGAAAPGNETERLEALRILAILDSVPEQAFDDLTLLAATLCDTPLAFVSLIDADRQWFKSHYGTALEQTTRELAFCAHAILTPGEIMEVPDTAADERFVDNPLVLDGPRIRFYAGAPLVTDEGHALGTLCVLDHRPRQLESRQRAALQALARQAAAQLKLRSMHRALEAALESARTYQNELEEYQSRLRRLNMQLHAQAITDPLTGLYNRLALTQQLNHAVARSQRSGEPLSLLLIDVDHFKNVNDAHGHTIGDSVLRAIGEELRRALRAEDIAARVGGEEFSVVVRDVDRTGVLGLADRLSTRVSDLHVTVGPAVVQVTVSIGIASLKDCDSPDGAAELLRIADARLYKAKAYRNCVVAD